MGEAWFHSIALRDETAVMPHRRIGGRMVLVTSWMRLGGRLLERQSVWFQNDERHESDHVSGLT